MIFSGTLKELQDYLKEVRSLTDQIPSPTTSYYSTSGKQFFGEIDHMINYLQSCEMTEANILSFIEVLKETKKQGYYLSNE